jgi:hypothetical protein
MSARYKENVSGITLIRRILLEDNTVTYESQVSGNARKQIACEEENGKSI